MPDEMTKAELEKIIKEKAKEEFQEQFKFHGKKDGVKMGEEKSDYVRMLEQDKQKRDVAEAVDKCIGDKCDMIAERVYAKIEKGQKVDIGDLKAEIAKANKTYEALQKKLEESDAKIMDAQKTAKESSREIKDFAERFMSATKEEILPHCENCGHDIKRPYVKVAGECSNPSCKSKFSSTDQENGFTKCPVCGAGIEWKKKKED